MTLLRRKQEAREEEEQEEEIPQTPSPMTPEKKHVAGDIEPIVDIIGFRVYQSEKQSDSLEFPREQYSQAKIFSKLLQLEKLATQ